MRYEESFKAEAVKLVLSGEIKCAEAARDLGVKYNTLNNWICATINKPKQSPILESPNQTRKTSRQDYQALERTHPCTVGV